MSIDPNGKTLTLRTSKEMGMATATSNSKGLDTLSHDNFGLTEETVEQMFTSLSNWGRWGDDDGKGTLNLLTPEKVTQAAALVREGVGVSLSRVISDQPSIDVLDPPLHHMTFSGEQFALHPEEVPAIGLQLSRDFLGWTYHGLYMTHLDATSHVFFKGQMYNNKSPELVRTAGGATVQSVEEATTGIVTRGVLVDIPRHRGVKWLGPGEAIGPDELEEALAKQGVEPGSGDVLIVRTGHWGKRKAEGPTPIEDGFPGLHAACATLLRRWDIAMLAGDSVNDVLPSGFEVMGFPIHEIGQVAMGLWLLDNCDLEDVAEACAARNRWEFMFVLSPLRILGGTGSPANPLAIF
jgi:kynurenine formamidase